MASYSIKDLEKMSGIKAHTIRIWERRFKIINPGRTSTNIRYYNGDDLKRILNISILCQNGYKISKIAQLNDEQLKKRIIDLSVETKNHNILIESLIVSMLELDENKFSEILTNSIIKQGFEDTVEHILFPFLNRIGILWLSNSIYPAQEHFISNLIRQKLIIAIDCEMSKHKIYGPRIAFFLPEGEYHELGLLFYSLLARKNNFDVIYLGASVPIADIKKIDQIKPIDILFTSFLISQGTNSILLTLNTLNIELPNKQVFINGLQIKNLKTELPINTTVITSSHDFKKKLELYLNI
ncbi:MAG: MerR family transcriptional regulator [Marinilabiliaceae bacterium]|nr:MerR family transcriptional regulator [Marinilabiliaceae bacterium]